MSYFDYRASKELTGQPFYALIMAAMRGADSTNTAKLRAAWPDVWNELDARYNAPGGLLAGEKFNPPLAPAEPPREGDECQARRVHPLSSDFYIQCTLRAGHDGEHLNDVSWTDASRYALPLSSAPAEPPERPETP